MLLSRGALDPLLRTLARVESGKKREESRPQRDGSSSIFTYFRARHASKASRHLLNGSTVNMLLSTSFHSLISSATSRTYFGLPPQTPRMVMLL